MRILYHYDNNVYYIAKFNTKTTCLLPKTFAKNLGTLWKNIKIVRTVEPNCTKQEPIVSLLVKLGKPELNILSNSEPKPKNSGTDPALILRV